MERIVETIVVEGKDDESAVKKAVHCDVIITHGYGIKESTFNKIKNAQERNGVIVFTDPDFAGEKIRKRIEERVPGCKHAFISRKDATEKGDIGVENASPDSIVEALSKVRTISPLKEDTFTQTDMMMAGLLGDTSAFERRLKMGLMIGIGYCNAKQFLFRLNHYGVTREEFLKALEALDGSH